MKSHYLLICILTFSLLSCKHIKKEPYTETEKISEELTYTQERGEWNRKNGIPGLQHPKLTAYCYVTNTSVYDGTFNVHFIFNSQGQEIDFSDSEYVHAGERKYFMVEKEINHYTFENNVSCNIKVIPPVIRVDKEVTKYRETVTYSLF